MTRLTISLSEEEAQRLRQDARLFRVSVSELVRSRLFGRSRPSAPAWLGVVKGGDKMTPGSKAKGELRKTWAEDLRRESG